MSKQASGISRVRRLWVKATPLQKAWSITAIYFLLFELLDIAFGSHDPKWLVSAFGWGIVLVIILVITTACIIVARAMDSFHLEQQQSSRAMYSSASVRVKKPVSKKRSNAKRK